MKTIKHNYTIYLIFLFVLFPYVEGLAQDAFALEKGNEWFYTINYYFYQPPVPPSTYKFSIIGDTVMSNGKRYWIIEPRDMFGEKYIRSDSQYVYYYEQKDYTDTIGYEKRVFNINAIPGTIDTIGWAGYMYSTADYSYQTTVFNKVTDIYSYHLGGLIFADVSLSKEFGYTGYEYRADEPSQRDDWILTGCIISDTLYGKMTDVRSDKKSPHSFILFQNYPNPFNPTTKIEFIIPSNCLVTLSIYNSLGQLLEVLIKKELSEGRYTIFWNASKYSSGLYFYRIESRYFTKTKKCLLIK